MKKMNSLPAKTSLPHPPITPALPPGLCSPCGRACLYLPEEITLMGTGGEGRGEQEPAKWKSVGEWLGVSFCCRKREVPGEAL